MKKNLEETRKNKYRSKMIPNGKMMTNESNSITFGLS